VGGGNPIASAGAWQEPSPVDPFTCRAGAGAATAGLRKVFALHPDPQLLGRKQEYRCLGERGGLGEASEGKQRRRR